MKKIKNVLFVDYIDTTNKVISWDLSVEGEEGKVIAWLLDSTTSGYYDLYIGAEEVIFPRNLYSFLSTMKMVDSISFDNLDTSLVTDMGGMFWQTGYNSTSFTLNLGDNFNTKNVTNMKNMFVSTGYNSNYLPWI